MRDWYGTVYGKILYPTYEGLIRRRPTLRYLRRLEQSQWASLDELRAMQGDALRRLVRHAWDNVPHYRQVMEDAGVSPDSIRGVDDLGRLPILTRELAREAADQRRARAGARVEIKKSTSGTSGVPLAFGYEKESEYWRQAIRLRGYGWAGYRPGSKNLHYWGSLNVHYKPKPWVRFKQELDHRVRRDVYVDCTATGTAEHYEQVIEAVRRTRPDVLLCYARAGAALARTVLERGARDWPDINVICGAERVFPQERAAIEAAFGPVFETYGSREVMLMACECPAHAGMHVSMENLIVETVVREPDGRVRAAEPGETGEVLVTDLHNLAMPFIRYQNGDLATPEKVERCACGREHPRLRSVDGRVTDVLRDAEGKPVDGLFFNVMFSTLGEKVRSFQVVQRRDKSIQVRIVPTASFDEELLGLIRGNCARKFPGLSVMADVVDDIPALPNGKRRPVVVES